MVINFIKKKVRKLYLRVKYNKLLKQSQINIKKYRINDDDSINAYGDVLVREAKSIPIKFDKVFGSFDLYYNINITSLLNCPNWVEENFIVSNAFNLKSHEDTPKYVGGRYGADYSALLSLDYLPDFIGKTCDISNNRIKIIDRPINAVEYVILYDNYSLMKITNSSYIKRLNYHESPLSYLIAWIIGVINVTNKSIKVDMIEILDRINEFDIIDDDYFIDVINLENLFYFYKVDATVNENGIILKRDITYKREESTGCSIQTSLEFVISEVVNIDFHDRIHRYRFK